MKETLIPAPAQGRKLQDGNPPPSRHKGTSPGFSRRLVHRRYTGQTVPGVCVGNDEPHSPTKKGTGGGLPVEVWTDLCAGASGCRWRRCPMRKGRFSREPVPDGRCKPARRRNSHQRQRRQWSRPCGWRVSTGAVRTLRRLCRFTHRNVGKGPRADGWLVDGCSADDRYTSRSRRTFLQRSINGSKQIGRRVLHACVFPTSASPLPARKFRWRGTDEHRSDSKLRLGRGGFFFFFGVFFFFWVGGGSDRCGRVDRTLLHCRSNVTIGENCTLNRDVLSRHRPRSPD